MSQVTEKDLGTNKQTNKRSKLDSKYSTEGSRDENTNGRKANKKNTKIRLGKNRRPGHEEE